MSSWNSPYMLSVIIGLIAVVVFYFDQQQKKNTPSSMEYVKVFTLVTGSILLFNYLVESPTTLSTVLASAAATSVAPSTVSVGGGGSAISMPSASASGLFNNLKIKEGPPNF